VRVEYVARADEVRALAFDLARRGRTVPRPRGCRACEGTGYRGRIALFEHMEMDAELRELVFRGESLEEIRARPRAAGPAPLLADGARKVLAGHERYRGHARHASGRRSGGVRCRQSLN
jgi:type II secretory ATPase GspE/PulE/Tfp pilus assembly ATPase PilB-like protein